MKKIIAMAAAAALLLLAGCSKDNSGDDEEAVFDRVEATIEFNCNADMAEAVELYLYYTKFDGKEYNSQVYTTKQKHIFEGKTLPADLKYWFTVKPKTNLTKASYSLEIDLKIDVTAYNTRGFMMASNSSDLTKTYLLDAEQVSDLNLSHLTDTFTVCCDEEGNVTIIKASETQN